MPPVRSPWSTLLLACALAIPPSASQAQAALARNGEQTRELLAETVYTERDADRIKDALLREARAEVARVWPAEPARESALQQFIARNVLRAMPQARATAGSDPPPATLAQKLEYLLFAQLLRAQLRGWVDRASELERALQRQGQPDARARLLSADLLGAQQLLSAASDELARRRLHPSERGCQPVLDAAATDAALGRLDWLLGELAPASQRYRAAIRALRGPACVRSDAARRQRAASLVDLGTIYVQLSRGSEAHSALRVAIVLYRGLTRDQPAAYRQPLAEALASLAQVCEILQRRDEAQVALTQAVELDRDAALPAEPVALARHARNLQALAAAETFRGRNALAWEHLNTAVALWRELEPGDRAHSAAALAAALAARAASEVRLVRTQQAVATLEEALRLQAQLLAEASPELVLPELAHELAALSEVYQAGARLDDALPTIKQAIMLFELMREELCLPLYAASLSELGAIQGELGHPADAARASERAVGLFRRALLRPDGATQLSGLASALTILGAAYAHLQRPEDARRATEEAAEIYRGLSRSGAEYVLPAYAMCLQNLTRLLRSVRPREAVIAPLEELVTVYRKLAQAQPAFMSELAAALGLLAVAYDALDRKADALLVVRQAHALYRQLVPDQPSLRPGLERCTHLLHALSPE